MRKLFSKFALTAGFVLATALTFSCSSGDDGGASSYYGWYGNGSAKNYTISTVAQLRGLADIVNGERADSIPPQDDFRGKTITLAANIKLNDESLLIGWGWSWSLEENFSFNGTFDGNNKTISGNMRNAIFGIIGEYGTVKNLVFSDFSYDGIGYGEAVLAMTNSGTVRNVGFNGNVSFGSGGGVVDDNYGIVENCYFSGTLSGDGGGVVGDNSGIVRNSYSTGSISGDMLSTGGVVGVNRAQGTVENCYSTSDVTNGSIAGGVVGDNYGTIKNCYATGSVVSHFGYAGGIAGYHRDGSIQNCVALNSSINTKQTSTLSRISNYANLTNNYALDNIVMLSGYSIVSDANGRDGADITSAEWGNANWWQNTVKFSSNVWEFEDGLPILKNMPEGTQNPEVAR
ncbi:MAG: hypothetical protein FWF63_09105 [Fibromonadales bacterium]|nr:hypothetical protein [Fibromonadales bacterium]